jgi:hypothetical protein
MTFRSAGAACAGAGCRDQAEDAENSGGRSGTHPAAQD